MFLNAPPGIFSCLVSTTNKSSPRCHQRSLLSALLAGGVRPLLCSALLFVGILAAPRGPVALVCCRRRFVRLVLLFVHFVAAAFGVVSFSVPLDVIVAFFLILEKKLHYFPPDYSTAFIISVMIL